MTQKMVLGIKYPQEIVYFLNERIFLFFTRMWLDFLGESNIYIFDDSSLETKKMVYSAVIVHLMILTGLKI